jgi:hypothetical protein
VRPAVVRPAGFEPATRCLEGFECSGAEQPERRSGPMSTYPLLTVNPPGALSNRARSGHAARSETNSSDRFMPVPIPAKMKGAQSRLSGIGSGESEAIALRSLTRRLRRRTTTRTVQAGTIAPVNPMTAQAHGGR